MDLGSLELFRVDKQKTSSYLVFMNPLGSNVKLALGYRKPRLYMSSPGLAQPPMLHLPGPNHMTASLLSRWG